MSFKKIAAGAIASVIAVSTLAITASADHLYQPTEELSPYLTTDGGNWLFRIYNEAESDAEGPAVSRDFDPWDIAQITFYGEMTVADDTEWTLEDYDENIDNPFSGMVIYSANSGGYGSASDSPMYDEENGTTYYGKYNWPQYEYYGLPDKEDTYEGRSTDTGGDGTNTGWCDWTKAIVPEYIKQYNYSFTMDVPDDMRWPDDPVAGLYRVGYASWSDNSGIFKMKINLMICRDDNGEILIATDGLGFEITADEAEALVAQWKEEGENEVIDTPSDDGSSDSDSSGSSNDGSDDSNASGDTSDDGDSTTTSTSAPASSNDSGNSSTPIIIGIIIAVVVIVVIIIVVVVTVVTKKKKS